VLTFWDRLEGETVLDIFYDYEFYDHPYDPIRRIVLGLTGRPKELDQMEEPFIWIERMMETHAPYGKIRHGNTILRDLDVRQYIRFLKTGKLDPCREYLRGVLKLREHILLHIRELEEMGLSERTLIVICSDHGEILDPRTPEYHNTLPCRELVEVPIIFIPSQDDIPSIMTLVNVMPTALDIMNIRWRASLSMKGKKDMEKVVGVCVYGTLRSLWELRKDGQMRLLYVDDRKGFIRSYLENILTRMFNIRALRPLASLSLELYSRFSSLLRPVSV